MKKSEESLRDLWDLTKKTKICDVGVIEGEENYKTLLK